MVNILFQGVKFCSTSYALQRDKNWVISTSTAQYFAYRNSSGILTILTLFGADRTKRAELGPCIWGWHLARRRTIPLRADICYFSVGVGYWVGVITSTMDNKKKRNISSNRKSNMTSQWSEKTLS
ncbi:hypothetical protein CEXT_282611 [Caerostris extrusa]|uniref:Uncharacterized protein n=1 Tax=Caerostris extrusa TaxID=172846 RepID=A0AAV4WFP8_CAEEX|nr:hypothetical protein CEXT_282611 [Caerostris extrusa]